MYKVRLFFVQYSHGVTTMVWRIVGNELFELKQAGFSDSQIAFSTSTTELEVRSYRNALNVNPVFKTVDTCAAEFLSSTPYHYSTYEPPVKVLDHEGILISSKEDNERSYINTDKVLNIDFDC